MNKQTNIESLEDFFKDKSQRNNSTSYASVIDAYNDDIHNFLLRYYGITIRCGAVIEDKLMNPTNEQIAYMNDIIGSDFDASANFISMKLRQWIQTLNPQQAELLSQSMYSVLLDLRNMGKNDSVLKNAYIKFMCWLYYCFRSVLSQLCKDVIPKIMYEGMITNYELYMLEILIRCGCDVLILDYGTQDKIKTELMFPKIFAIQNSNKFPDGFSIKSLKSETIMNQKMDNICGPKSTYMPYRNAWLNEINIDEIMRLDRADNNKICSTFLKFNGADDRNAYSNRLYKLYADIKSVDRKIIILDSGIPKPDAAEINNIKRNNCKDLIDVMLFIISNLHLQDNELIKYAKYRFREYLMSVNAHCKTVYKTETAIVKTLALFNRYSQLFSINKPGCLFILENTPLDKNDYDFLSFLSEFPIDIVIFNPAKIDDGITDTALETTYDDVLSIDKFPTEMTEASYSTTAFNAENDLTSMLYQDSGIYRNHQYKKAEPIILKTMYEEIEILWKEDTSMRPGFSTDDYKVIIPTIFAKVCGVKDGNKKAYVKNIEKLIIDNDNVLYVKEHFLWGDNQQQQAGINGVITSLLGSEQNDTHTETLSPINIAYVMTNGKIDEERIRKHTMFKFDYLRDETVHFMVNRLQYMLESKTIDGIGTHGTENLLLSVFFNLPKNIVNLIQKFDFTKINPKIVYVNAGESTLTLEETILIQYLSFLGFDIVMYIPTGYNVVEKYFAKKIFTEYQIGEYMFNLNIDIRKKKGFFK